MNRFEFYDNVRKFKENQEENSLAHYGTKGQKWGERHWQNPDGTFNEAGKERYFGSSGKKDLSKEKVGGKYKTVMNSKGYYNTKYQNDDGSLTRKGQKLYDKAQRKEGYHLSGIIDEDFLKEYNNKQDKQDKNELNKIKEIDDAIKITKDLKGKNITDEEFDIIAKDVIPSDYNKLSIKDYDDIADLGLYKMIKADILGNDAKPGDDSSREWFMEEDQTIGYPELVDLYRKGYSKDYVDKFLQKMYKTKMEEEDGIEKAENISWALSESAHWLTEGDRSFLDALYDDKEISGLSKESVDYLEKGKLSNKDESDLEKYVEKAVGSISKPKVPKKYLNEDGTLNDRGKDKLQTNKKISEVASAIFKVLKYINIGSLAISTPIMLASGLAGLGVPVTLGLTLLNGIAGGGAVAVDHVLYKKLEQRADAYYDMLKK